MSCLDPLCPQRGLIAPYDCKPLGIAVELFTECGAPEHQTVWRRALQNWNFVSQEYEKSESKFLSMISPFQTSLVRLLYEWWTGATEDSKDLVSMLSIFMENSPSQPVPQHINCKMSGYFQTLFNLFVSEFVDQRKKRGKLVKSERLNNRLLYHRLKAIKGLR